MNADHAVRTVVRAELGPEVFARRPWRALLMVPLVALDAGICLSIVLFALPWYAAVPLAVVLGNLRAGMMFHGHEITHGGTVRSCRLQNFFAWPGCASFFFSPTTWRAWHNRSHHGHTNQPGKEPDNFGTLEEFFAHPERQWYTKLAPGNGYWYGFVYIFIFFPLQAQAVIWAKSKTLPGFGGFSRVRAGIETALILAFWTAVAVLSGWPGALYTLILPQIAANLVILGYVLTNHMLRPLSPDEDALTTSMSVTTFRVLDWVHFHFSHHIEHHLFPAVCSNQMPRIRKVLQERFGDRYLSPPHWKALWMIFRTPRVYDGFNALIQPYTSRRQEIPNVETALRS